MESVRRQDEVVERPLRLAPAASVLDLPPLDVDGRHSAAETGLHAELTIQLPELLGHAPDPVPHEAVVAVEDRTGIHERHRERGVRLAGTGPLSVTVIPM